MSRRIADVPTAHVADEQSTSALTDALEGIHGPPYGFAVRRWHGPTALEPHDERVSYHVVIESDDCGVDVRPGDLVRGPVPGGPYRETTDSLSRATDEHTAAIWPGDVITVRPGDDPVVLTGSGAAFRVRTERTPYTAPRFGFLRNVRDDVGGCAEYENAFRREVLPPDPSAADEDARGVNRLNQHTLDMRHDREPEPVQHCHAPVSSGGGQRVNHTETAIVLDRSSYDLPPVGGSDEHVRIFRHPREEPADWVDLSVEPGSIVVTPATDERVYGHCFRNAFAVLVAVPSFTAPLIEIGKDERRRGETHRKYHE